MSWSLLLRLDSAIIGSDQDAYINPWADMWSLKALQDSSRSLWFTDYLFYPQGTSLTYHSFSHLTSAVSLTLRTILPDLAAYNVAILLHLVLAGLSMFHLARYLSGSALAGLLAGIVFAFNSHNIWQTAHPVLVSIWPLPWSALFLLQAFEYGDRRRALIAAIFVLLAALCSSLMLILAITWLVFVLFFALITGRLRRPQLPVLAVFAASSLLLVLIPLSPLLGALLQGNASFVVDSGPSIPGDVLAPLVPYSLGLLPRSLHFGIVPLFLLIAALGQMRKVWPWFLFLGVVYLFVIGPQPLVSGRELDITLPWSTLVQPLLRHTHRLNVLLSAALAVLVAAGFCTICPRIQERRRPGWLLAMVLGTLIFAEYALPPFPFTEPQVSEFYTRVLSAAPEEVAVAILPTGRQEDKLYMYYQTLHEHKMTGGVVSRPDQNVFDFIRDNPLLRAGAVNWEPAALPDNAARSLADLAQHGIGFVILEKQFFDQKGLDLDAWRRAMPVAPVYEDSLVVVFPTASE